MNSCNPTCTPVITDEITAQNSLPNYFGMCLTPSTGGVIDLGFIDSKKYTGNIVYTSIEMERWYNVHLQDIQIGNYSVQGLILF